MKINSAPVFFLSLVGVDEYGVVDEHEHIFDIYTKLYDFGGSNVIIINAQDVFDFYKSKHKMVDRKKMSIYKLADFFVEYHPNGHFVVDECPFRRSK